jgi:hypothetical protein
MKREASTGVNDCSFHMKDVWYMPHPVTNMARAGLSCMKWLNQCPVECLIIREVWTGVTDRLFSYMKVVLSTAPCGMLDNTGSLNWCEWSFTEFNICKWFYLQRPVINMSWEGFSCVKWLNQCPVECLIIREAWTGVTDRLFSYMKVVLSTVPCDKYVVGRLELCEMIKPVPRGMLDNTGSLNWCDWSFIQLYESGFIYRAPW